MTISMLAKSRFGDDDAAVSFGGDQEEIEEGEGGQARGVGGGGAWPQNADAVWQRR
jgi:hypothetical protein